MTRPLPPRTLPRPRSMTRLPLVTLIALATLVPCASADAQQRIIPFVGGGVASGTGDLRRDTNNGWLVYGGLDVPLGLTPGLSFGVTGSFAHIPYAGGFSEATNMSALFGEVGYTIGAASSSVIKPYVRAGAGMQLRKYDPGTTAYRERSNGGVAVSAGGGLQLLVGAASVFAGAHFVTDADAGFVAFHAGLAFPGRARTTRGSSR